MIVKKKHWKLIVFELGICENSEFTRSTDYHKFVIILFFFVFLKHVLRVLCQ